jgi:branched-chain amino acid transport system permease protein
LLATQSKLVTYQTNYYFFFGLVWVVLVVTMGARSVQAAITAGFVFVLMPELLGDLGISPGWATVLFGVGALTYARHPEGIVEYQTRSTIGRLTRLFGRGSSDTERPPPPGQDDAPLAVPASAPAGGSA